MFKYFSTNILLVGLMIIFSTTALFAQSGGKISGTIKDQNNATILGASVTALNIASSQKITVTTDASGKYVFTGLRDGTYRITANANGFADSAETIVLSDGATETKDFQLSLGGIKDVVSVTAGKGSDRLAAEIPQIITVASAEQIEQRVPRSTFEVMERAPNIGSIETNPARERPRLRGLSSNRLLVADVVKYFITNRQKFSPKLQAQYAKITGLGISSGSLTPTTGLAEFTVSSHTREAAAYATDVKPTWEVFRDIATSKFGSPSTLAPFPSADAFTGSWQVIETDAWKFEGLEIKLAIRSTNLPSRTFTATLVATDPSVVAANKGK